MKLSRESTRCFSPPTHISVEAMRKEHLTFNLYRAEKDSEEHRTCVRKVEWGFADE